MWPQTPVLPLADDCVLSEVNAILISFDADVAQLRDMVLNRLIFYPPQMSKGHLKTAFAYLQKRVDLHDKKNIFHFNIIPYLNNEFQLMLFLAYLKKLCYLSSVLFYSTPAETVLHKCFLFARILERTASYVFR